MRPKGELKRRKSEEVPFSAGLETAVIPTLPVAPRAKGASARDDRWAVILAGGDGTRLQPLTRLICGDDRPKQFCPLLDGHSLLANTVRRAERSIPSERTLFALMHTHREFYLPELDRFERQRIIQPANKGTAPPILFSVLSIERMDADALVAILPSDHYYSDETRIAGALESAFEIAAQRPESVVLIGAQPDRPEIEYGWIELGPPVANENSELRRVRGFWEKPSLEIAQALLGEPSAWNTFVMVAHVRAFRDMAAEAIPDVLDAVRQVCLWTGSETHIDRRAYHQLRSSDFSSQVLSAAIARLLVLSVRNLGWSDLGNAGRVLAVLEESRSNLWWMKKWRQAQRMAARAQARPAVA